MKVAPGEDRDKREMCDSEPMTWEAIKMVLERSKAKGPAQLVLLRLADLVNRDEGYSWPGYTHLADVTGFSRRHVMRLVQELCELGELHVETRKGQSNHYFITLGETSAVGVTSDKESTSALPVTPVVSSLSPLPVSSLSPYPSIDPEKDTVIRPIPPHGVKSANQSILIADRKKKRAESPKKKELSASAARPAPELTVDELFKLWNATTGERCKRLTPCDTGDMVTPKFRAMVQKRLDEQPRKDWWRSRFQDLVWSEYWGNAATLPMLLGGKHWDPFSSGQYKGNKPRVPGAS